MCVYFNNKLISVDTYLNYFKYLSKYSTTFKFSRNFAFGNIVQLASVLLPVLSYCPELTAAYLSPESGVFLVKNMSKISVLE